MGIYVRACAYHVHMLTDVPAALLAFLALLALAMGAWLALRIRDWLDRRARRYRASIAQQGERSARRWLESNGFTILEEQATRYARMRIDGAVIQFDVCADYIVERNGRTGIVEVKTGANAHPASRSTRRQIFEYAALFDADAYVFDANELRLHTVSFEATGRKRPLPGPFRYLWWGLGAGVALSVICFTLFTRLR